VLRRPELHELIAACDSFVSLHRSEGFGLGIAEAMYLGKPVIATNYSGNVDFTKQDNSCLVDYRLVPVKPGEYLFPEGQVWADPNVDQAAMYMRRLAGDRDYAKRIGSAGTESIRRQHSAKATGARYAKRLKQIAAARALLVHTE
ncbi:MAG: glycosyltransferase, partial [Bryobacteraceae bacterium]